MNRRQFRMLQEMLGKELAATKERWKVLVKVDTRLRIGPGSIHHFLDEKVNDLVDIMSELDRKYGSGLP